ncbi:MAG: uracil-DNA glycosylase [Desulfobacterales bacterium]
MAEIDCHRCEHYFVTWEVGRPHGCRAMGFKSRLFPSALVRRCADGATCRLYSDKQRRKPGGAPPA